MDYKINEALNSSRSTVMKYGGKEGIKAYHNAS